jgi:tetratricopeptide (TPR) repeat protein
MHLYTTDIKKINPIIFLSIFCSEGNNYFKNKQYAEAIQKYKEAIIEDASDVTFYSNKSACHAALNEWEEAAEDGRQCIITDKSFVKGYFRAALALQNLGNLEGSLDAVKRGLGIDSTNADLKRMSRELDEAMRVRRVDAAISAADNQLSLGKHFLIGKDHRPLSLLKQSSFHMMA